MLDDLIVCPRCKSLMLSDEPTKLVCSNCNSIYPVQSEVPCFLINDESIKIDIQTFWDALLKDAYDEDQFEIDYCEKLLDLRQLFEARRHLAAIEIDLDDLHGKTVLEIGCGAGAFSSLFALMGARVLSLDITPSRAFITKKHLSMVNGAFEFKVLNADAEFLPISDASIDIVFSNGVLHHTVDTAAAVEEIHRVLKPGGYCAVMLYAKHSYLYWINLVFLRGLLQGKIFLKGRNWLGAVTEWMSKKPQIHDNPITKVYSATDVRILFKSFDVCSIRKSSFVFQQIPYIGWFLAKILNNLTVVNHAGHLIYGHPWRHETLMELWLGRLIGFNLNIHGKKSKN